MANVQLDWTIPVSSPDPIDHFRVEREGTPNVIVADNLPATADSVVLTDEPNGTQLYRVFSVSADGDENSASTSVSVVDILPSAVTNLSGSSV